VTVREQHKGPGVLTEQSWMPCAGKYMPLVVVFVHCSDRAFASRQTDTQQAANRPHTILHAPSKLIMRDKASSSTARHSTAPSPCHLSCPALMGFS
jgi:hypothetical protein